MVLNCFDKMKQKNSCSKNLCLLDTLAHNWMSAMSKTKTQCLGKKRETNKWTGYFNNEL